MLKLRKYQVEKLSVTHFGLQRHEAALFESMMKNAPDLVADYELRAPNEAGACHIVVVNKDSQLANSWWKTYKKTHPSAVPLFLTDSREDSGDSTYCKRPFSPSFLTAAVQEVAGKKSRA
jgi:hypothetical protein